MSWYFSKDDLHGDQSLDEIKTENAHRKVTCAFLQEAGMQLRLPQLTIATAIVFFHRFYVKHKLKEYERNIIGATCLFLAGKVEETPKKLKDVIEIFYKIKYKMDVKTESTEFIKMREDILTHELIVLQTIGFDLTVEHPYKYLLTYVKGIKGNKNLAQVAWNFVNDSLRTTLCLQFKPQLIASAAIYLASKFLKYDLPEGKKPWWEVFDAKIGDLDEISNQILDLYESSPNVDAIKSNSSTNTFTTNNNNNKEENIQTSIPPLPPGPPPPTIALPSVDKEIIPPPTTISNDSTNSNATDKYDKRERQHSSRDSSRDRDSSKDRDRDSSRDRDSNRDSNRDRHRTRSRSPTSKRRHSRSRSRSRSPRSPSSRRSRSRSPSRRHSSSSSSHHHSSSSSSSRRSSSGSSSRDRYHDDHSKDKRYHPYSSDK